MALPPVLSVLNNIKRRKAQGRTLERGPWRPRRAIENARAGKKPRQQYRVRSTDERGASQKPLDPCVQANSLELLDVFAWLTDRSQSPPISPSLSADFG